MILTGRQIRDGRILAGLSQAELAAAADVAVGLVVRIEAVEGMPMLRQKDAHAIRRALEAAGVEFVAADGGRPGVQLQRS